ncbi:MAG TPA: hypothetical protein VFR94_08610 [Nitrososphaeraceae archaeon]|nr:hypothetical protein [Nitrososphaeraceae archaeon]
MTSYQDSVHALRELIPPESNESSSRTCRITKLSHNVSHLENGIEYCLVEVTCDDGEQYGIQAFGREAVRLHKEALERSQALRKEDEALSLVL